MHGIPFQVKVLLRKRWLSYCSVLSLSQLTRPRGKRSARHTVRFLTSTQNVNIRIGKETHRLLKATQFCCVCKLRVGTTNCAVESPLAPSPLFLSALCRPFSSPLLHTSGNTNFFLLPFSSCLLLLGAHLGHLPLLSSMHSAIPTFPSCLRRHIFRIPTCCLVGVLFGLHRKLSKRPDWNSKSTLIIRHPTPLLIESCTTMQEMKQIQARMIRTGLISHIFPVSRLLAFCALSDSGDIDYARCLFTCIEDPNSFVWNTMIRGYCRAGNREEAVRFFGRMCHERVYIDAQTFVSVLKACEQFDTVLVASQIHGVILKFGCESQLSVLNGLIHVYVTLEFLMEARQVFIESTQRDVVSWTTLIDWYSQNKLPNEAVRLFGRMIEAKIMPNEVTMITALSACSQMGNLLLGISIHKLILNNKIKLTVNLLNSIVDMYVKCGHVQFAREMFDSMREKDVYSWTSLINGYAKCGQLEHARSLFDEMPERNVISWSTMIAGYAQANKPEEALKLFNEMQAEKLIPVEGTLVSVLSACSQCGNLELGRWIHDYYVDQKRVKAGIKLSNALVDMYAKYGDLETALRLFKSISKRDLVTWNSIISGCAVHGQGKQAIDLFDGMQDTAVKPDDITFVGVLSACSHCGLIAEGRRYFETMTRVYRIAPKVEHYTCMIDLLGRVGLLEEACKLIKSMPMKPDIAGWGALLNACRMHGNVELGELAVDNLVELDAGDSGIYVLLSNIYASRKRWEDVKKIRRKMNGKGVTKLPGCSSIEVDGVFHDFLVDSSSHPQSEEIYDMLDDITLQLKHEGYVPRTSDFILEVGQCYQSL